MILKERLDTLLGPSFRAYVSAEIELSSAAAIGDELALATARQRVILTSRQAASELHQFSDAVAVEQPAWLPPEVDGPRGVQKWVQEHHCRHLRQGPSKDMDLLHDIQDAMKHVELRPRANPRQVTTDKATVAMQTGYGQLPYGEGKFGGAEQLVVTLADGKQRALSAVLQNVVDAWRSALGSELPPINE